MSGVAIGVTTRADQANRELAKINANLNQISDHARQTSAALGAQFKTNNLVSANKSFIGLRNNISNLNTTSKNTFAQMNRDMSTTRQATTGLSNAFGKLAAVLAGAAGLNFYYKAGDELVRLQNRIRIATNANNDLTRSQNDLYKISKLTRSSLEDTVSVYSSFARSLLKVGASQEELLGITATIQKAVATSGMPIESVRAALLQLSQGISSGTLRGEELNSVLEQIPSLGQAIARQLKMTTGELRKFAEEGKLTTPLLQDIFKNISGDIDKDFQKTSATAEQALQRIGQSVKLFVGTLAQARNSAGKMYTMLSGVADAIDKGTETLVPGFFIISQSIKNFIYDINTLSTSQLVLKKFLKFDSSLLDVVGLYREYTQLKKIVESFLALREKLSSQKSIGSVTKDAATSLVAYGKAAVAMIQVVGSAFSKVSLLMPDVRLPVRTLLVDLRKEYNRVYVEGIVMYNKYIKPLQRNVEGFFEFITFYSFSDTSIERALVDVLQSNSIKEFTNKLHDLRDALRSVNLDNQSVFSKDFEASMRSMVEDIKTPLRYLGILENRIVFINALRFDRLADGIRIFGNAVKRVYDDVLRPYLLEVFTPLTREVQAAFRIIHNIIQEQLGDSVGEDIGRKLARGVKLGLSSLSNLVKDAWDSLKSGSLDLSTLFNNEAIAKSINDLKRIFSFFISIIKGFFSELFHSTNSWFTDMVNKVEDTAGKLLKGPLKTVKKFTSSVEDAFHSAWDKVVGHSFWPDLVDGVNDYTNKLDLSRVESFTSKATDFFAKAATQAKEYFESTAIGKQIKIKFKESDLDDFGLIIKQKIGASVLAGMMLIFGGPVLKTIASGFFLKNIENMITAGMSQNIVDKLGDAGAAVAESGAVIAKTFAQALVSNINAAIDVLPRLIGGFTDGLIGANTALRTVMSKIPAGGLLSAMLFGSAIFATSGSNAKDHRKLLKKTFSDLTTFFDGFYDKNAKRKPIAELLLGSNKRLLTAGVATLSTALLSSVSGFEATLLGAPMIMTALFGGETAGKFFKRLTNDVIQGLVDLATTLGAVATTTLRSKFDLAKILLPNVAAWRHAGKSATSQMDSVVVSPLRASFSSLMTSMVIMLQNMPENIKKYASGKISLKEIFTKEASDSKAFNPFAMLGVSIGAGKSNIANSFKDFKKALSDALGASTAITYLKKAWEDFGSAFQKVIAAIRASEWLQALAPSKVIARVKAWVTSILTQYGIMQSSLTAMSLQAGSQGIIGKLLLGLTSKNVIISAISAIFTAFMIYANKARKEKSIFDFQGEMSEARDQMNTFSKWLFTAWGAYTVGAIKKTIGLVITQGITKGLTNGLVSYFVTPIAAVMRLAKSIGMLYSIIESGPLYGKGVQGKGIFSDIFSGLKNISFAAFEIFNTTVLKRVRALIAAIQLAFAQGFTSGVATLALSMGRWIIAAIGSVATMGIGAVLAGIGAGLGALMIMGPEGSFLDKLDFVKDKILEFVGFGVALKPRMKAVSENLRPTVVNGQSYNLAKELDQEGLEKLEKDRYEIVYKTSQVYAETAARMREMEVIQGSLNAEQQKEWDNAVASMQKALAIIPKIKLSDSLDQATSKLLLTLTTVDNSVTTVILRFVHSVQYALHLFAQQFPLIAAALVAPFEAIAEKADEIRVIFASMIELYRRFRNWRDSEDDTFGLWAQAKRTIPLIVNELKEAFLESDLGKVMFQTPDPADIRRAYEIAATTANIRERSPFIRNDEQAEFNKAISDYNQRIQEYRNAQAKNVFGTPQANKEVKVLGQNMREASAYVDLLGLKLVNLAKRREAVKLFKDLDAEFQKLAQSELKLDDTSLLSDADVNEIRELASRAKAAREALEMPFMNINTTTSGVSSFDAKRIKQAAILIAQQSAKAVQERAASELTINSTLEYQLKVSGIDASIEDLKRFFNTNKEGYETWKVNIDLLSRLQQNLSEVSLLGKTGDDLELAKQQFKDISDFIDEIKQRLNTLKIGKDLLSGINLDASYLGVDNITNRMAVTSEKSLLKVRQLLAEARIEKEKFEKGAPENPTEYIAALKNILSLTQQVNLAIRELIPENQRIAENLGTSMIDVGALSPSALKQARKMSTKKELYSEWLKNGIDSEGNQLSEATIRSLSRQVKAIDKASTKMFEELGDTIFERFSNTMQKAGITLELTDFIKLPTSDQKIVQGIIGKMQGLRKQLEKAGNIYPSNAANFKKQLEEYENYQNRITTLVAKMNAELSNKSFTEKIEAINSAGYEIDLNSSLSISDTTLSRLQKFAEELKNIDINLGDKNFKGSISALLQRRQDIQKEMSGIQNVNAKYSTRTSAIQSTLGDLGVTDEILNRASGSIIDRLYSIAVFIKDAEEIISKSSSEDGAKIKSSLEKWKKSIDLPAVTDNLVSNIDRFKSNLDKIGISVDKTSVNLLKEVDVNKYSDIVSKIIAKQLEANTAPSEDLRIAAQTQVNALKLELSTNLSEALKDVQSSQIYTASSNFATSVTDAFSNGIKDILKFKETPKDAIKNFVSTFAESVVDTFVAGLMSTVTGENGSLTQILRELGSGLFGIGLDASGQNPQKVFSNSVDAFGKWVATLTGQTANINTPSLNSSLENTWDKLKDFGSGLWNTVSSWFASGGFVSGPGSSKSDSIPAMLSNGEFVINAAMTKKYLPLLESINNGKFGKFATGGLVRSSVRKFADGGLATDSFTAPTVIDFSGITTGLFSLSDNVFDFMNSTSELAQSTNNFSTLSLTAIGKGFNGVATGFNSMGQYLQTGFAAVGLALAASSKPGKFNWGSAILTLAAASYSLYSSLTAPSLGSSSGLDLSKSGMGLKLPSSGGIQVKFAAEGGPISGPGTATSDSIFAMLSNGEFVVNALATSKYRPLLEAINNNKLPKFATGGYVSSSFQKIEASTKENVANKGSQKNQSVFYLNITGDISRQTRQEIQQMIPQIANGVNGYNAERGVKR